MEKVIFMRSDLTREDFIETKKSFTMTVGQLQKELENYDPDTLIVMSKDAEGNEHLPMDKEEVSRGMYDFYEQDLTPINGEVVVVFYPLHR